MRHGLRAASIGRPIAGWRGWSRFLELVNFEIRARNESRSPPPFVTAWTINDPEELRALRQAGVDAVITDAPAIARSVYDDLSPTPSHFGEVAEPDAVEDEDGGGDGGGAAEAVAVAAAGGGGGTRLGGLAQMPIR